MHFRLIYDDDLAQAAYLIGCQRTGEAIVIDPARDVDRYLRAAGEAGLKIVAAAETHVHADFLSGARELAELGVKAYVSGCAGPDWTPKWLGSKAGGGSYDHHVLADSDKIKVGNITLIAHHTPGHTPEHVSYGVIDADAGEPMGVATGDFVFVGDLGRPDLLESAAGVKGTREPGARELWKSTSWFRSLPEYAQVWPGHGAGSACGKALGAVPQSTVGYELRHNAALRIEGEDAFVRAILDGQPDPPGYFARMKRMNVEGAPVLGALPEPKLISAGELPEPRDGVVVLDLRPWGEFRAGHVPGSLNADLDNIFTATIGSYIEPHHHVYMVAHPEQAADAVRRLVRVGIDRFEGYALPEELGSRASATLGEVGVESARAEADVVLDVRRTDEYTAGHVPGAVHICHTQLAGRLDELPTGARVNVICKGGRRSARASALLAKNGFTPVNVAGGFDAYRTIDAPVES
ncbi:MAG: MBL fold metallo-hydrolase [Phycisphaeraceae bacterium]|nr:MAG: MBL fold metallo-hydrolase [Phycisphaeraceae bacterium]